VADKELTMLDFVNLLEREEELLGELSGKPTVQNANFIMALSHPTVIEIHPVLLQLSAPAQTPTEAQRRHPGGALGGKGRRIGEIREALWGRFGGEKAALSTHQKIHKLRADKILRFYAHR
jgi:hypothetical protein